MVANLNGTHSYFLAFRLPTEVKLPYRIALKSELNGRWLHASYLFAPTIVLLDEASSRSSRKDIAAVRAHGLERRNDRCVRQLQRGAEGRALPAGLQLRPSSSRARPTGSSRRPRSPTTAATVKMGSSGSYSIPHGPDGSLWIGIMDSAYKKAVDSAVCGKPPSGKGLLNELPLPWSGKRSGSS